MRFADLAEILRRVIGQEAADKAIAALCSEASGEQVYIPSRHGRPKILPNDTPKTVQKRHNVSRSTAYNWVNRWRQ